ncbi:MAG TPA: DUF5011 domain-containing protein [Tenericutes bacterium]|nr:DUF5011 domain-containing protein [Mycoplasmatota bacterium]
MNNKKGFTLPELMGVIVILGVLALILFPIIDKTLKESNDEVYKIQIKNIELGAMNFVSENIFNVPQKEGEILYLSLGQLKDSGHIDKNITNPKTNLLFSDETLIKVTKIKNGFNYEVTISDDMLEYEKEIADEIPTIELKGKTFEYVELNSTGDYVDLGYTSYFKNGDVNSDINVEIYDLTKEQVVSKIPLNKEEKYIIKYKWSNENSIANIAYRTVIVKDSTAPILNVPADSTIPVSAVASLNLNTGVTATDNSGKTPELKVEGSVLAVAGRYTITYTAKDSSGNETIKKRIITVQ